MQHPPVWLVAPALGVLVAAPAYGVQYMTLEQAQKQLFSSADGFIAAHVALAPQQKAFVENTAGVRMRYSRQPVWKAMAGDRQVGWFVQDEVFGKHEYITYAVALDMTGAVTGIEVLEYRETHGREIRNANWRAQFHGKKHGAPLKLYDDIQNISGATLSCKHISEGVRRILALYEAALK